MHQCPAFHCPLIGGDIHMDNPPNYCVAGPIPMDVDPPGEGLWDYPTPPSLAAPLHPNVEDVGPPNPLLPTNPLNSQQIPRPPNIPFIPLVLDEYLLPIPLGAPQPMTFLEREWRELHADPDLYIGHYYGLPPGHTTDVNIRMAADAHHFLITQQLDLEELLRRTPLSMRLLFSALDAIGFPQEVYLPMAQHHHLAQVIAAQVATSHVSPDDLQTVATFEELWARNHRFTTREQLRTEEYRHVNPFAAQLNRLLQQEGYPIHNGRFFTALLERDYPWRPNSPSLGHGII